jgi:hypothetical protein
MARHALPLVLLGATATVILRRRLMPRPALPPGQFEGGTHGPLTAEALSVSEPLVAPEAAPQPMPTESRFVRRLRRAPIDIVTVVDDLLGATR